MASYTLLDYVQTILSSLDSDEVNSYSDTVESLQVANIVRTVYNDIQARANLPEHHTLAELIASTSIFKPVLMTRPSEIDSIVWIQYDCRTIDEPDPRFQDIKFLPLDEFLKMQDQLKPSDENVDSFDQNIGSEPDSITFIYRRDKAPQYWTTFDDHTIIFDSHDASIDGTLQKTKTRCYGRKDQSFVMANSFVPFLDRDLSTLLLNEAKILAFSELKQVGHDVARQWASRGWTKIQKSKRGLDQERRELDRLPNYGRIRP